MRLAMHVGLWGLRRKFWGLGKDVWDIYGNKGAWYWWKTMGDETQHHVHTVCIYLQVDFYVHPHVDFYVHPGRNIPSGLKHSRD